MNDSKEMGRQMSACFFGKNLLYTTKAEAENSVLPGGVEMYIVFLDLSE